MSESEPAQEWSSTVSVPEPQHPTQNLVSYPEIFGDRLFLDSTVWHGVPVALTTLIPDGQVVWIGEPLRQVMVGCKPRTDLELAGYAARCAVQHGLADVLEWLGERPLPFPPVTGAEVLDGFRRGLI